MKRVLLSLLVLSMVLVFGATFVSAESDNAAIVIKIDDVDERCEWGFEGLSAEGTIHYVGTKNGKWKLTCTGDIVSGLPIDRAVQVKSTPDNPVADPCFTPFGNTLKWHATFSPSGKATLVCQGDLTP